MKNSEIGDIGYISVWEMLQINTTLESFEAWQLGTEALKALISALPDMRGLKHISTYYDVEDLTSELADDFVEALEQNTSLETQTILRRRRAVSESVMQKVVYLLKLNRAGRRIVKSRPNESVPRSCWPLILGRSSKDADALFFFLREKADAIFHETVPVPRACWPLILGRSSKDADALFFFLRENADAIFCETAPVPSAPEHLLEELAHNSNVSSLADADGASQPDSLAEDSDSRSQIGEPAENWRARAERAEAELEVLREENHNLKAQLEAMIAIDGNEIQESEDANRGDEVGVGDDEPAAHSHATTSN